MNGGETFKSLPSPMGWNAARDDLRHTAAEYPKLRPLPHPERFPSISGLNMDASDLIFVLSMLFSCCLKILCN
jgi:hypothetical protein